MDMGIAMTRDERPAGRVCIVGSGPGDESLVSPQVRRILEAADVVIGYHAYIHLVDGMLHRERQLVVGKNLTEEIERAALAVQYARLGLQVAVVSSGDAGIYGMAGVVFEYIARQNLADAPEVEVLPGISAFQAAAARLGAPLMHDFAAVSLSDLLTPWPVISERLHLAAQADFVLALYNPQSRKRQRQWVQAQEIIRACRPGSTPVGVVRNAYRDQESVVVTDLDHIGDEAVDMLTTVLIGNSQSFVWNSRIITPRGYYAPKPDGPRVLVLGGTHEARLMARRIRERGAQVTLSYRGPAPASKDDGVRIYSGDFDVNSLTRFLREREIQFVVDMTHMDASIIHTTAQQAAMQCAVPYLRWERPESIPSNPLVREVPSHQEAARALRDQAGTVFLTTGIKSLETYVAALGTYRAADLVVRLLPRAGTLAMAESLGLGAHQIVAMVGPYSRELNGALYDRYHVQAVVTKSSSDDLHSKVEPALERLIPVIVVRTAPASSGGLAMTLPEIEGEIFGGTQGD